jgi:ArsR family transcriptional regulator, arsenate/arsenite/antimonite-responsive transcriptional repressor
MPTTRKPEPLELNAERLRALGHPIRLSVLRLVVQGPEEGTPAGEIQEHVGIPASTLSHHLACLSETELVQVEREGTFLRYRANFGTLRALTEYLWKDCCSGGAKSTASEERPRACCGARVRAATPKKA